VRRKPAYLLFFSVFFCLPCARQEPAEKDVQSAIRQYHELKAAQPKAYDFSEDDLKSVAYRLFQMKKLKEAVGVLKLDVDMNPESFSAYDSLAEAYMLNGDKRLAARYFEKSLALNRFNWNAAEMLKKLKNDLGQR
jgi:tetratricopeptide (TPR) repeat protein